VNGYLKRRLDPLFLSAAVAEPTFRRGRAYHGEMTHAGLGCAILSRKPVFSRVTQEFGS